MPLAGGPLRNLKSSYQWGGGLGVWYDPDEQNGAHYIVVQMPGQALGEIEPDQICHVLRDLLWKGFKATRVDIAVDHYNASASWLIDKAESACLEGCLVGARTFEPQATYSHHAITRRQLNIGKRGKQGSGRYVRVYDKGLETQTDELGQWVRYEAEFTGDAAKQVAESMAEDLDPLRRGLELAFGAFTFREAPKNEGERVNASRRAECEWWVKFTKGIETCKVVASRAKTSLSSYARWFARAVGPSLKTYAKAIARTPGQLFDWLAGDVDFSENAVRSAVFRQLCAEFNVRPDAGMNSVLPCLQAERVGT